MNEGLDFKQICEKVNVQYQDSDMIKFSIMANTQLDESKIKEIMEKDDGTKEMFDKI